MPPHASREQDAPAYPPLTAMAEVIRAELPSLAAEIVEELRLHVPEIGCLLAGESGDHTRRKLLEELHRYFEEITAGGRIAPDRGAEIRSSLVARAVREGCGLNTLQAACQVGARVAWRYLAEAGRKAGVAPDQMYSLAESIFVSLEKISEQSAGAFEGFEAEAAGTLKKSRIHLLHLLLSEHAVGSHTFLRLAREAQWRVPERVACVAVDERYTAGQRLPPGLDADVLVDLERTDPCLLVPAPDTPGRYEMLRRGLAGIEHAVGPVVALGEAALSLRLARDGLSLMLQGLLPHDNGQVRCDLHLPTLHLIGDEGCLRVLSRRALDPLSACTVERRARLSETLLVWLSTGSALPGVAERLSVHPQTVRYRMRQIEELFGERLYDPEWRFEMELALRFWQLEHRRADRSRNGAKSRVRP